LYIAATRDEKVWYTLFTLRKQKRFVMENPVTVSRKNDHLRINLEEDVRSSLTTGFEKYHFVHQALPEVDLEDVRLEQVLFGRTVRGPILISSMTGGSEQAGLLNRRLAEAAQETGIALGLGSMRAALENPQQAVTFQVRKWAPDVLLLANLGAVQLNYGVSVDDCRRLVELAEVDGLILHLNPLQEALQPEGDTRFGGLLSKIEQVCRGLEVPVIVKEVGWGISEKVARQLAGVGVAAIDVAGAGGTSWSQVEMYRIRDPLLAQVAAAFRGWGIPTAEALKMVRRATPGMLVFASGGLRGGLDIAKSIALGACLGGMAGPFLKAAIQSTQAVVEWIHAVQREIQIVMFVVGAANLTQLQQTPLLWEE
jgi:isopentenyl-diphosphate delta-isomerase